LRISGTDANREARILELTGHPFFVATLFVPQLNSSDNEHHPLVAAFLETTVERAGRPSGTGTARGAAARP
jgi:CTP synthase (UTP-ammonia lyase)